jgi:transposase
LDATALKFPIGQSGKKLVVFYQDEARFGRISREYTCWVHKDMVPSVARQMVREYIYAYAALSPQTGDCFSIISPLCNTDAMNVFLQKFAEQYDQYRIVLILDKAGWHISNNLILPENIQLLHLAPYSPELNPVELLWRETRAKNFHNLTFESLDEVENQLGKALNEWHCNQDGIKQLSKGFLFNTIDSG